MFVDSNWDYVYTVASLDTREVPVQLNLPFPLHLKISHVKNLILVQVQEMSELFEKLHEGLI